MLKDCAFAKDFSLGNTCSIGLVDFLYEILSFSPNLLQAAEKTSACSFDLGSAIFLVGWVCVMCFLCCHSSETKQTNLLTNLYVSIALQVAVRCMIPRRLILSDVQILQAAYIGSLYSRVFLFLLSKPNSMFCDDSNNNF